ncbi:MAG TPA: malto-oligosyltrehalose trehalohydrolase [Acetobacteraceae bacterium]|nr:malto-oligosyltrehalose trehalohydrolase [Acetobacteraceae bacterium]
MARFAHRLPFGATLEPDGTTRFRVWAPSMQSVALEVAGEAAPMRKEAGGWFAAERRAAAGTPYIFVLPDGMRVPDPASRAQSGDVHDPSLVVDPLAYDWQHPDWRGRPWNEAVIYEVHAGLAGGFAGVRAMLPELAALGVTAVELMPVADFPGARNWGYDGVLPFAPDAAYGTPDDLKRLVDAAHGLGLMMFLDVVYNHFGPDGAYMHVLARPFFREDIKTPWGAAIDFRRPEVRRFFIENARYWLHEYRFDGLRFDAVHAIEPQDFLEDLAAAIRDSVPADRHVHLVLEHGGNAAHHLRASGAEAKFDAQWSDDWHHCVHVLLTGEHEGYYGDFQDATRLLARCLAEGFAYQGERSGFGGEPRGEPSAHLPSAAFVIALQNHDQTGNRAFGERLVALADPAALRAATVLLLLSPFVPLLLMGEEWGTRRPFLYFTSHNDDLAKLVLEGRRDEFRHFSRFQDAATRARIPDPNAPETFAQSRPDHADPATHDFYRDLLHLRAARIAPAIPGCRSEGADVLGPGAVLARWRMGDGAMLSIAVNLCGQPAGVGTAPAGALLTAPAGALLFESEAGADAGLAGGRLPPRCAVVRLAPA